MKGLFRFEHKDGSFEYYRYYGAALNAYFEEYGFALYGSESLDKQIEEKIIEIK